MTPLEEIYEQMKEDHVEQLFDVEPCEHADDNSLTMQDLKIGEKTHRDANPSFRPQQKVRGKSIYFLVRCPVCREIWAEDRYVDYL